MHRRHRIEEHLKHTTDINLVSRTGAHNRPFVSLHLAHLRMVAKSYRASPGCSGATDWDVAGVNMSKVIGSSIR
jgi:hypothetical protein